MTDRPMFRFTVGKVDGVAMPTTADRVAMSIGHLSGGVVTSIDMPANEARAMANALYEAAEASERVAVAAVMKVAA